MLEILYNFFENIYPSLKEMVSFMSLLCAPLALFIANKRITEWKNEHIGKKKQDAKDNFILSLHSLKSEVYNLRFYIINIGELTEDIQDKYHTLEGQGKYDANARVYYNRFQKVKKILGKIEISIIKLSPYTKGDQLDPKFKELRRHMTRLYLAIGEYHDLSVDPADKTEYRDRLIAKSDESSDDFSIELNRLISEMIVYVEENIKI